MALDERELKPRYSWLAVCGRCFPISSSSMSRKPPENGEVESQDMAPPPRLKSKTSQRKPGGWKSMPFVLGNETFERLATIGLLANFTVFLMTKFNMDQVSSSNLINIWSGVTNFAPLVGAFVSDAYVGKFRTIAFSSFASLLGMVTMTLIVSIPHLHPPSCTPQEAQLNDCNGPTTSQLGFLAMALGFLTIGTSGIRPCSLPFGVDQFDPNTDDGRKGIASFFNWYYTTFTIVLLIALTVVVYIQDSVSWVIGFGIPTGLMVCSIVLFFVGTKLYVYVKPEGSIFTGIAQTCVAAFKKRKLEIPENGEANGVYYDPPMKVGTYNIIKLPLTEQVRCFNKAAIILEGELLPDGSRVSPWKLPSIQQIEEAKCLVKVIPVLASSIVCFLSGAQQGTFTVSQALKMDRHLGKHFQIPPGSLGIISMITLGLWLPFYDRVAVPYLRKVTKLEGGITLLQRIGIGIIFSILSMVVAGVIEKMRRNSALVAARPDGVAPLSVIWLFPQLVLMGFAEAFNVIGQIEFYYKEFPENMKSIANALFFVTSGLANYLSSALVMIIHNATGRHGEPDWLAKDINAARVDYFYYTIAVMGVVNMIYFLVISPRYRYKTKVVLEQDEAHLDVELNSIEQ